MKPPKEIIATVNAQNRFVQTCGIDITLLEQDRACGKMLVREQLLQPSGYLHGGATISLLETLASLAAWSRIDPDKERCFGTDIHVRHRSPGNPGMTITGTARLDKMEGNKLFWEVVAKNNDTVISEGVIVTKTVTLERLAAKQQQQAATPVTA